MLERIHTPGAPEPRGHYEQGLLCDGVLYLSAQLPITLEGQPQPELDSFSPTDQAELALNNLLAVVRAAGGSVSSLLQLRFYIADVAAWPAVNEACQALLGEHKPTRAVVPTGTLHLGYSVAVEGIARIDKA